MGGKWKGGMTVKEESKRELCGDGSVLDLEYGRSYTNLPVIK